MERNNCFPFVVFAATISLSKGTEESQTTQVVKRDDSPVPSVEFMLKISHLTVEDLVKNYVDGYKDDSAMRRMGGGVKPKPAFCKPESKTVKLVNNLDPNTIYVPMCTRLEQCGGCCGNNRLVCEPTETEPVSFKVLKTQFTGGRLTYRGTELVDMERHKKCGCGCRIKAKDCNAFQEYRPNECNCICTNKEEEKNCNDDNTKMWDPDTCQCRQP